MTISTEQFNLGELQVAGPLAVIPVFGPTPLLDYQSLADAMALGALVREIDGVASVNDLLVDNRSDQALLVFEGEEVLGAKQNRTFDAPVLISAHAGVQVPVSCVEQGRWSSGGEHDPMKPAPQAADPRLRRIKRESAHAQRLAGLEARADQGEVWRDVQERIADMDVDSPSGAMSDIYDHRRDHLGELTAAIRHQNGQLGALVAIGGEPRALDLVSRPEVFASLLPRLAQGYALDALSGQERPVDSRPCEEFLRQVLDAPRADLPTPGRGRGISLASPGFVGSGLEAGGELISLSAFASDDHRAGHTARGGRIRRPSRRRPR